MDNIEERYCIWKDEQYDPEDWETGCGEMWCLLTGTPEENRMKFCPYCGKKILQVIQDWDEDGDM